MVSRRGEGEIESMIPIRTFPITTMFLFACASAPLAPSTPQAQLTARFAHASATSRCPVSALGQGSPVSANCIDDDGLVWSACAWNGCGVDLNCRVSSQDAVERGSCGGDEWPACVGGERAKR